MGLLEEKINRILQLRLSPHKEDVGEIDVTGEQALYYDTLMMKRIKWHWSLPPFPFEYLAWCLQMNKDVLKRFLEYHSVSYYYDGWKEKLGNSHRASHKTIKERLVEIEDAIKKGGAQSYEEVADLVGMGTGSVRTYCYHAGISLGRGGMAGRREQKISQIRNLVAEGKYTRKEIAEKVGLALDSVRVYAWQEKIKLPSETVSKAEKISQIRDLVAEGKYTRKEIAEKVGLALDTLISYASKEDIRLPTKSSFSGRKKDYAPTAAVIKDSLRNGERSLEALCSTADVALFRFHRVCKEYKILLPEDLIPWKTRPEIDGWVEQGLTLEEIGGKVELTRERVRQYIKWSGQHAIYMGIRKRVNKDFSIRNNTVKSRKTQEREILFLINQRLARKAQQESWPMQKMVEYELTYRQKHDPKEYTSQQLLSLFTAYDDAAQQGEQLSLEELEHRSGISFTGVGRMLKRVGLEPMYGPLHKRTRQELQGSIAMIDRLADSDLSSVDVAYFTGEWGSQIHTRWRKTGVQKKGKILYQTGNHKLTYRLASEMYEADDLGFNSAEIQELYEKPDKLVQFALNHREKIGQKLMHALWMMYPLYAKEISTPYLTTELKQKTEGVLRPLRIVSRTAAAEIKEANHARTNTTKNK